MVGPGRTRTDNIVESRTHGYHARLKSSNTVIQCAADLKQQRYR